MSSDQIWNAAELDMPPGEHHRLINERVVTDLSLLDSDDVARARAIGQTLLEQRRATTTSPK